MKQVIKIHNHEKKNLSAIEDQARQHSLARCPLQLRLDNDGHFAWTKRNHERKEFGSAKSYEKNSLPTSLEWLRVQASKNEIINETTILSIYYLYSVHTAS